MLLSQFLDSKERERRGKSVQKREVGTEEGSRCNGRIVRIVRLGRRCPRNCKRRAAAESVTGIAIALTKAILTVEGASAAASRRVHGTVADLTGQVVASLTRRAEPGRAFPIAGPRMAHGSLGEAQAASRRTSLADLSSRNPT
jgi:hypothetical protein